MDFILKIFLEKDMNPLPPKNSLTLNQGIRIFHITVPFMYLLKTSENQNGQTYSDEKSDELFACLTILVFWRFQGVQK